jgi:hypothetical protein
LPGFSAELWFEALIAVDRGSMLTCRVGNPGLPIRDGIVKLIQCDVERREGFFCSGTAFETIQHVPQDFVPFLLHLIELFDGPAFASGSDHIEQATTQGYVVRRLAPSKIASQPRAAGSETR